MGGWRGDAEHLLRIGGLFLAGAVVFVVARGALVPEGFGRYGHYRAGAIEDNRNEPTVHAGRAACAACHGEAAKVLAGGAHARVGCEGCHGPLAAHAADPAKAAAAGLPFAVLGAWGAVALAFATLPAAGPAAEAGGTLAVCVVAVGMLVVARRTSRTDVSGAAAALLAVAGLRLALVDLPGGRPGPLFVGLVSYGAALLAAHAVRRAGVSA